MKARRPNFDFSKSRAHWAPNHEFAQYYNAASVPTPYLERFLNKVMAKAAAALDGDDETTRTLRADIRAFIRQESNHLAIHEKFNEVLRRDGYDIAALEMEIEAHYDRLLATKSLNFLIAYSEGFETLGPPAAYRVLDKLEEMYAGADPEIVSLWKWHLMEEFEHRTVCYDAFEHFHGGYFLRVYAYIRQMNDLRSMMGKVRKVLLDQDRAGMNPEQLAQSEENLRQATRAMTKGALGTLLRALLPWYTPRSLPEPDHYRSTMAALEPRVT